MTFEGRGRGCVSFFGMRHEESGAVVIKLVSQSVKWV